MRWAEEDKDKIWDKKRGNGKIDHLIEVAEASLPFLLSNEEEILANHIGKLISISEKTFFPIEFDLIQRIVEIAGERGNLSELSMSLMEKLFSFGIETVNALIQVGALSLIRDCYMSDHSIRSLALYALYEDHRNNVIIYDIPEIIQMIQTPRSSIRFGSLAKLGYSLFRSPFSCEEYQITAFEYLQVLFGYWDTLSAYERQSFLKIIIRIFQNNNFSFDIYQNGMLKIILESALLDDEKYLMRIASLIIAISSNNIPELNQFLIDNQSWDIIVRILLSNHTKAAAYAADATFCLYQSSPIFFFEKAIWKVIIDIISEVPYRCIQSLEITLSYAIKNSSTDQIHPLIIEHSFFSSMYQRFYDITDPNCYDIIQTLGKLMEISSYYQDQTLINYIDTDQQFQFWINSTYNQIINMSDYKSSIISTIIEKWLLRPISIS